MQGHVRNGPTCVGAGVLPVIDQTEMEWLGICARGGRAFRMVLTMTGGDLAPGELVLLLSDTLGGDDEGGQRHAGW